MFMLQLMFCAEDGEMDGEDEQCQTPQPTKHTLSIIKCSPVAVSSQLHRQMHLVLSSLETLMFFTRKKTQKPTVSKHQ